MISRYDPPPKRSERHSFFVGRLIPSDEHFIQIGTVVGPVGPGNSPARGPQQASLGHSHNQRAAREVHGQLGAERRVAAGAAGEDGLHNNLLRQEKEKTRGGGERYDEKDGGETRNAIY